VSIVGFITFFDDNFVSILNGLALGMLLFVLALGVSLIFGLLDVLNLAHGSLYLLGTYLGFQLAEREGIPFLLTALLVTAIGLGLGIALNVSLRPVRGRGHLDQALVTLGLALIVGDLVTIIWGTQYHQAPEPHFLQTSTQIFGHYYPVYQLAVMVVGFVLFALVYTLVERTQLGAILRAAVEDADMVGALGINVRRVMLAVLVLGAGLATFAGVIGGGAILIESIFDLQGVGQYAAQSIQTLDVPPIMVIVMYTAVLVVVVAALVDVLYAFLDPRISLNA